MPIVPPPAPMLAIFDPKVQVPRSTSTILPASEPGANAAQPFRLPPAPSPYCIGCSTVAASGAAHGWKTAVYVPAMPAGAVTSYCGWNALGTAVCATESALGAAPGVPVTYGLSLELPAEATVRMPSFVAPSTAATRSSSNGWP